MVPISGARCRGRGRVHRVPQGQGEEVSDSEFDYLFIFEIDVARRAFPLRNSDYSPPLLARGSTWSAFRFDSTRRAISTPCLSLPAVENDRKVGGRGHAMPCRDRSQARFDFVLLACFVRFDLSRHSTLDLNPLATASPPALPLAHNLVKTSENEPLKKR